ncbi:MAG: flagellin [Burkholderiales bacterium]|nr:flagellin [Burkholderiales bacterium]
MASVINTNVSSLNTQRNLASSQSALATSIQRLSTGLRVNSAKDDAAGLAISERMSSQVRGLNVAARNANDGISLAQTAEGSLGKVGDMLQRMRELAVQSANATNSQTDRDALNAEVTQLKEEIGRVADTTNFNGTKLLDGSFTAQNFQVGANAGETIQLSAIVDARLAGLGQLTPPDTYDVTATAVGYTDAALASSIDINGVTVSIGASVGRTAAQATTALAAAFDVAKAANATELAGVTLDATTGVIKSSTAAQSSLVLANLTNITGPSAGTTTGTLTTPATQTGITNLTVATAADSASALTAIDSALTAVNTARGNLGAVQSRFENAISNIQVTSENLSAARSRIVDTDFASETANLTRSQILQQAGNAMLSQANQQPQQVLALLR